jgi:UDP:flavonoid glycosyltransferase YjiC (YdhE family)
MRVLLGAFGDPGHAFPMLALGAELADRGHDVCLQTWRRWAADVEAAGMTFAAAPEYQVFPTLGRPMRPYVAAVAAARDTEPLVRSFAPDVCVADILTLAPDWAAERHGVPVATLVPHVSPLGAPGLPPYAIGARLPRTRAGARLWGRTDGVVRRGLERGRRDYNAARARLGLPARGGLHTGLSRSLTLIGTLPALEYPRAWPAWMRVVGPLLWEPPGAPVAPPAGDGPVVLVAPSTAHDAEGALLRAALDGLAAEPVRVIATWNGRRPPWLDGYRVPANAVLVDWLSYAGTMPACDVVICHGGHGTLVRALVSGCAVVVSPAAGDMFENAARADWAGVGVRLPRRLLTGATIRLAVRRALADAAMRARARAIATSTRTGDGAAAAADEVERWAAGAGREADVRATDAAPRLAGAGCVRREEPGP